MSTSIKVYDANLIKFASRSLDSVRPVARETRTSVEDSRAGRGRGTGSLGRRKLNYNQGETRAIEPNIFLPDRPGRWGAGRTEKLTDARAERARADNIVPRPSARSRGKEGNAAIHVSCCRGVAIELINSPKNS